MLLAKLNESYFDCVSRGDVDPPYCTGYGFTLNGSLTNPEDPNNWGENYGIKCNKGDIIEMNLDMNERTLTYKINDDDYGVAFHIDGYCKYCAAISLGKHRDVRPRFVILSCQQLY